MGIRDIQSLLGHVTHLVYQTGMYQGCIYLSRLSVVSSLLKFTGGLYGLGLNGLGHMALLRICYLVTLGVMLD